MKNAIILLAFILLLGMLSVPVFADEEPQVPEVLGASIRSEGEQGLRFIGRIKKEGTITLTTGENANFGFLIIPEPAITNTAITKETPNVKKVPAVYLLGQKAVETAGLDYDFDYYYFSVVLKGIPTNFYEIKICVKSYIDNNGTYIYSDCPEKKALYSVRCTSYFPFQ